MPKKEKLCSLALTRPLEKLKHENDDDGRIMTDHKYVL
jgi:hypothetical protein